MITNLCGECGNTNFKQTNVKGLLSVPWKAYPKILVTSDLELPICSNCGNYILIGDAVERLNEAIETSIDKI